VSEELYYIENKDRGHVGNSILWWKWDDHGYTCDVRAAKKFSEKDALRAVADHSKYAMHRCKYIDSIVQYHIDFQDLHRSHTIIPHTLDGLPIELREGRWELIDGL